MSKSMTNLELTMEKEDAIKNLGTLFMQVLHIMDNAIKEEVSRKGISPKVGVVLYQIYKLNNPSPLELAHFFNRKPQTITAIVHRMEREGLVKKEINPNKKNTYKVQLTEKGLADCKKMMTIDVLANTIDRLSDERRKQLQECLEEILIKLKEIGITR
jgi:DNA-binding MarR family transcriptional regulator